MGHGISVPANSYASAGSSIVVSALQKTNRHHKTVNRSTLTDTPANARDVAGRRKRVDYQVMGDVLHCPHGDMSRYESQEESRASSSTTSLEEAQQVLERTLTLWRLVKDISKRATACPSEGLFSLPYCLLMSMYPRLAARCLRKSDQTSGTLPQNEAQHYETIIHVSGMLNFEPVDVPGDGNCFFTSVAFSLARVAASAPESVLRHMQNIGLESIYALSTEQLANHLREMLVEEWTTREDLYRPFLPEGYRVRLKAKQFLQSGYFNSRLGDLMPLGMANALRMPFVIVTSSSPMHIYDVIPERPIRHARAIYLAYNGFGAGHYNALIERDSRGEAHRSDSLTSSKRGSKNKTIYTESITCCCGSEATTSAAPRRSCVNTRTSETDCPCHLADLECHPGLCVCRDCHNMSDKTREYRRRLRQRQESGDKSDARRMRRRAPPREAESDDMDAGSLCAKHYSTLNVMELCLLATVLARMKLPGMLYEITDDQVKACAFDFNTYVSEFRSEPEYSDLPLYTRSHADIRDAIRMLQKYLDELISFYS